jgi:hypothetical protein
LKKTSDSTSHSKDINIYQSAASFRAQPAICHRVNPQAVAELDARGDFGDLSSLDAAHDQPDQLHEGGLHFAVLLGADLQPLKPILVSEFPALTSTHFPLGLQVAFVPDEQDLYSVGGVCFYLLEPVLEVLEGLFPESRGGYLVMS